MRPAQTPGLIMKSEVADTDVLIVGGGFSGTMMAAQLRDRGLRVTLVEGGGRAGRGTAYSTRDAVHLLNVPAGMMSAWPERPDDFVAAGHEVEGYASRREFGSYLYEILDRALTAGVELIERRAISAVRDGAWQVGLSDGSMRSARTLILAQGNQPPEPMRVGDGIDGALFVNNPWGGDARAAIDRVAGEDGAVLILGTGLTMIDLVLSLATAGHCGRIVALSRRGQVPRDHAPHDPAPVELAEVPQGKVLALWRWVRGRSSEYDWRGAVDSLRPYSHVLWRGLSEVEQRRFLRHARPYWDVHRHRIAPQVAAQLASLIAEGRLEVIAGRITGLRVEGSEVLASYAPRHGRSADREERFSAVFNCTGPLGAMKRTRDPLLRQMIDGGLISIDRLGMGIAVDGDGLAGERVWALGPLTKGAFWEIVAVPDIRGQVAQVADHIARELKA